METAQKSIGWNRGLRRFMGWAAVCSLSSVALVGLFVVLFQPNWPLMGELLATVSLFGLSAALSLGCVWAREAGRGGRWLVVGLVLGVVLAWCGWVSALYPIWSFSGLFGRSGGSYELRDFCARAGLATYSVSATIAYAGLFALFRVRGAALAVRRIGVLGAAVACATVLWVCVMDADDDWVVRPLIAGGILAGVAIILVPVLAAMFPAMRIRREEADGSERVVPFTCPACGEAMRIPLHRRVQCPRCTLGCKLTLDAPKCACGYDLTGLTRETCPECGAGVEQRHRWALDLPTPPANENAAGPASPTA